MADQVPHETEREAEMEDWDGEDNVEAPELPLEVKQYPICIHKENSAFILTLPVKTFNLKQNSSGWVGQ